MPRLTSTVGDSSGHAGGTSLVARWFMEHQPHPLPQLATCAWRWIGNPFAAARRIRRVGAAQQAIGKAGTGWFLPQPFFRQSSHSGPLRNCAGAQLPKWIGAIENRNYWIITGIRKSQQWIFTPMGLAGLSRLLLSMGCKRKAEPLSRAGFHKQPSASRLRERPEKL